MRIKEINTYVPETNYSDLMNKSMNCQALAIEYYQKGESDMAYFFKNAANGYKEKALHLTVKEGSRKYA